MEEYPVRRKKPCVGKKLQNRSKNGMGSSLPLIQKQEKGMRAKEAHRDNSEGHRSNAEKKRA